jgi:hypothetical protein
MVGMNCLLSVRPSSTQTNTVPRVQHQMHAHSHHPTTVDIGHEHSQDHQKAIIHYEAYQTRIACGPCRQDRGYHQH